MINSVFGKTMGNLRKHRGIKLVTADEKRSKLISEPNYHTNKWNSENLSAIEMKKTKVKMNKPVHLGMSILDISKTFMYKFWYKYTKPKYRERAKLCYTDTDGIITYIMSERFLSRHCWWCWKMVWYIYDENDKRPLPIGKTKKIYGFFKDELGRKTMKEFAALREKTYACLMDADNQKKKAKGTKKCVIKRKLLFKNYRDCLFNGEVVLKWQQRFKSDYHKVYTEEVIKIALSNDDDKRLQTFDGIEAYPYGTANEMLRVFESKEKTLKL